VSEGRSEAEDGSSQVTGPALLFLHEVGDAGGATRWRALAGSDEEQGWRGAVLVPDLPGHGVVPPEEGAYYAPGDVALVGVRALAAAGLDHEPAIVAGHGWGAFGAELLAAAGRASALVLVDGLGGPWVSRGELIDAQHRWLRAVLADPAALAPPPAGALDPRLRHGFPSIWERGFTEARRAAITVPVLALESPASSTPPDERAERVAAFGGDARAEAIAETSPQSVMAALSAWSRAQR
jgi:pimeloyl-ACP methyl ester carboxylesterase